MGADRWIDPQLAKGRQERMSFGELADARRVFPVESGNKRVGVISSQDRRASLTERASTVAAPRPQVADEAAGKRASTMRSRNEDDPTNFRNAVVAVNGPNFVAAAARASPKTIPAISSGSRFDGSSRQTGVRAIVFE